MSDSFLYNQKGDHSQGLPFVLSPERELYSILHYPQNEAEILSHLLTKSFSSFSTVKPWCLLYLGSSGNLDAFILELFIVAF